MKSGETNQWKLEEATEPLQVKKKKSRIEKVNITEKATR
jgi:hypothetical protein